MPSKIKNDKRSTTSKQNAEKARQTKLDKLAKKKQQEKQEHQQVIEEALKKVQSIPVEPEYESEEEVLIINPPPVDPEKMQKKMEKKMKQKELYEWMQAEKMRKQNKQPKTMVIQMPQPHQNKLSEDDEKIKSALLSKLKGPQLKF